LSSQVNNGKAGAEELCMGYKFTNRGFSLPIYLAVGFLILTIPFLATIAFPQSPLTEFFFGNSLRITLFTAGALAILVIAARNLTGKDENS
jgi:hypothetical protein